MSTWFSLFKPRASLRYWMLCAAFFATIGLLFGALLLGVAGWLIAAGAMAGIGIIAMIDIFAPGAAIRAFAVGRTVSRYLERLIGHEATLRQLTELRVRSFRQLLRLPPRELNGLSKGDTLSRLTSDIDTLDHLFPKLVLPSIAAVIVTLLAGLGYVIVDIRLGWITLFMFGLLIPLVLVAAGIRARVPGRALAESSPRLRMQLAESLGGIKALKSIGQIERTFGRIQQYSLQVIEQQLTLRKIEALTHGAIAVIGFAAVWLLLLSALLLNESGVLHAPWVVLIVLSSLALVDAWTPLANGWSFFETCRRAAERLDQLAPAAQLIQEDSAPPDSKHTSLPLSLHMQSLEFRYHVWSEPILRGCSLDLEVGQRIVINGDSGCGKSTLGQLLAGLLIPTEGSVLLGGLDLQTLSETRIRSSIGYLPQHPVLFHDTLRANLRLANAQASDAEMLDVLEQLQLAGFYGQLPNGLDSWIGEHGQTVSGGEARRLALARLMLGDFNVLIMDEPTAGLDSATAANLSQAIEPWLKKKTVIMLSHDVTTVPNYDLAFRLEQGVLHPIDA